MSTTRGLVVNQSRKAVESIQTAVRLPKNVFERLKKSDLGVSGEIRARIERTFTEDEIDAPTLELRDFLVDIAAQLRDDYGTDWHKAPRAYQAFVAAIIEQLRPYEPVR